MSSESKHEVQGAASPAARQVQQDLDEVAREGEDAKRPSSIAKGVKRCAKCGEVKALSGFSNRRKAKDGLQPYCRQCDKAKSAQRRVEHREVIRARKKALRASYAARTDAELLAIDVTPFLQPIDYTVIDKEWSVKRARAIARAEKAADEAKLWLAEIVMQDEAAVQQGRYPLLPRYLPPHR